MLEGGGIKYPSAWIIFLAVFLLGYLLNSVPQSAAEAQVPMSTDFSNSNEVLSPGDWINESQVKVTSKEIKILVTNASWAKFAGTNSMDPVIDEGMNSIEAMPESPEQLSIGDIISYKATFADGVVVHRIVDIKSDEEGIYYVTKGDNNPVADPQKVRFSEIKGVVIGILF